MCPGASIRKGGPTCREAAEAVKITRGMGAIYEDRIRYALEIARKPIFSKSVKAMGLGGDLKNQKKGGEEVWTRLG